MDDVLVFVLVGLPFGLVFLAGVSEQVGVHSAVLFLNRVTWPRFVLTLLLGGVLFMLTALAWMASIWFIAKEGFGLDTNLLEVALIMTFSYLPLLFGVLIFLPYLGPAIGHMLHATSLLIAVVLGRVALECPLWQSFLCCVGGWLLLQLVRRLLNAPLGAVTKRLWQFSAGVSHRVDIGAFDPLLIEFARPPEAQR